MVSELAMGFSAERGKLSTKLRYLGFSKVHTVLERGGL